MRLPFPFILLFIPFLAQSQAPETADISSFYAPGKELIINKLALSRDLLAIQYSSPRADRLEVTLSSYASSHSKNPITESQVFAQCDADICRMQIDMSSLSADNLNYLRFTDIDSEEQFFYPISPEKEKVSPIVISNALDEILLNRTFPTDSEIIIKSNDGSTQLTVIYYSYEFSPADPPSGVRNLPSKDLLADRSFTIRSGSSILLDQVGLYFIQTDTESNQGYGFRVERSPFPSYSSLDDLIKCMIYISTADEWGKLEKITDKKAFDSIWLEAAGNENNARSAIRNYYRNIKEANMLFTSYKEGWKTDKGMIYSIYGAPNVVKSSEGEETWEYNTEWKDQNLTFVFYDRSNVFSTNHSSLVRNKVYASSWHYFIDKLRKGITIN